MKNNPMVSNGEISIDDFAFISKKAKMDFGLNLDIGKRELVQSRLSRRIRVLELPDFAAYCSLLETPSGQQESMHMLSALTTNVTSFFREPHHFEYLENEISPYLKNEVKRGKRVRIWSAGCSAGHEPYSIAASILTVWPKASDHDLRILATDVDPKILDLAREGSYSQEEVERVPKKYCPILFQNLEMDRRKVRMDIRKLVYYRQLNLISKWPMNGKFDIIFCRNVAIYFDRCTQQDLWHRFHNILKPGGMLMIGHSERLSGAAEENFSNEGITTYRRETA